jgi:hypothetical protein
MQSKTSVRDLLSLTPEQAKLSSFNSGKRSVQLIKVGMSF